MRNSYLSKSRILSYLQCPVRLWLETYRPDLAQTDDSADSRMEAGNRVGEVAREVFSGGLLIQGSSMAEILQKTQTALRGTPIPLYEASFLSQNVLIRADILLPDKGGCTLVEVKSSTKVKGYHLQDIAVQAWVLKNCGVDVRGTEIACIDSSFVYPGNNIYQGLFRREDVRGEVDELLKEVPEWVRQAGSALQREDEPRRVPGTDCGYPFACPFLEHCAPAGDEKYPVECLPRIGSKAEVLREQGYADIRNVPENFPLNERQRMVRDVTVKGCQSLNPDAATEINALPWPRWYMDFETIQFAVPEWAGTRPYAQIPFQWSCHLERKNCGLKHYEFLSDINDDPRRAFAESLLACINDDGPVIVYNAAFERRILKETAAAFPDLSPGLMRIADRLYDLLPLARNNYYHPDMYGSWSLKAVLPTIAPDLDYSGLEVSHGGEAQQAFLAMLKLAAGSKERAKIRADLLTYCERDTVAMVRIAHFFSQQP